MWFVVCRLRAAIYQPDPACQITEELTWIRITKHGVMWEAWAETEEDSVEIAREKQGLAFNV